MSFLDRITIDPNICHGKPCIRGLRYPVETILELLSSGMTTVEILADYEDLEREDVLAALEFAAQLSRVKRVELQKTASPVNEYEHLAGEHKSLREALSGAPGELHLQRD